MARVSVEKARRQALVDAAIAEVGAAGSLDVTVQRIARRAGVSAALAHHYFGSKDRILLAAMRSILSEFTQGVRERLRVAEGPRARLAALVEASFDGGQTRPHVVSAWLVFYVQALHSPHAARLLRIYRRRLEATILHDAKRLAPEPQARRLAMTLGALIDGLYVRCAPAAEAPPVAEIQAAAHAYLDAALGEPVAAAAVPSHRPEKATHHA